MIFALSLTAVLLFMSLIWLFSVRLKNASIVDIFWGTGFVYTAAIYFFLTEGYLPRKILIMALVAIWGLRLSYHIFRRNHGKGEDPRYAAWRQEFGPQRYWWISFFQVFMLQGVILWVVSFPLMAAQSYNAPFTVWDGLGLLVWGVGFYFEAVGDRQLAQFKANPANKGKIMNTGLWAYTRHPNYFGDAAVWWGFYLIAFATSFGFWDCVGFCSFEDILRHIGGWWTIFSPIIMTALLMRVSGVTLLEKSMEQRPGYKEYIASTSSFFPLPPKKSS